MLTKPTKPEEYLFRASELRRLADNMGDAEIEYYFLRVARNYERMAETVAATMESQARLNQSTASIEEALRVLEKGS